MWLLMADQIQKGNINHPLLMLKKGMEEKKVMDSELGGAIKGMPTVLTGNDIYSQMLRSSKS